MAYDTLQINSLLRKIEKKKLKMKNISQDKSWIISAVKIHVEPPPIPLIKTNNDLKTESDYVRIKLCRNPTSEKSTCMSLNGLV